jgi:hypothetical protein
MKLTSIVLAAGLLAVPAIALAQSSASPNNQSGPGVSPTVQSPTDMAAGGNASGNTKAVPARSAKKKVKKGSTMGAAPKGSSKMNKVRNASPASPDEGAKKEK